MELHANEVLSADLLPAEDGALERLLGDDASSAFPCVCLPNLHYRKAATSAHAPLCSLLVFRSFSMMRPLNERFLVHPCRFFLASAERKTPGGAPTK